MLAQARERLIFQTSIAAVRTVLAAGAAAVTVRIAGLRPGQEQVMLAGAVLVPLTLAVNPTATEPPAGIAAL